MNKLLSKILPFDGSKTIIGGWMLGLSMLGHFFPALDIAAISQYILSNPSKTGIAAIIIGMIHKELKRRASGAPN